MSVDLQISAEGFRAAVAALDQMGREAVQHVLGEGPRPELTSRLASALDPWLVGPTAETSIMARAERILDAHHLVTEPPQVSPLTARMIDEAVPSSPLTGLRRRAGELAGAFRPERRPLDARRIELLRRAAFGTPDFALWLARVVRDHLAARVVLHPGPPPVASPSPRTGLILVALVARPAERPRVRATAALLLRQARRDLTDDGWAGFWDAFLMHLAATAIPGLPLADRLPELPIRGDRPPPGILRDDWQVGAPDPVMRYLDGDAF